MCCAAGAPHAWSQDGQRQTEGATERKQIQIEEYCKYAASLVKLGKDFVALQAWRGEFAQFLRP